MRRVLALGVIAVAACAQQGLDVGSNHAEAKNDTSWFASSSCTAVGPDTKPLWSGAWLPPGWLEAHEGAVWFSTEEQPVRFWRLPVTERATPNEIVTTGVAASTRFALFGGALAYARKDDTSIYGPDRRESVVLRDLASGAEQALANPGTTRFPTALVSHPFGLFWASGEWNSNPLAVSRFDGNATEITTLPWDTTIATDGAAIYFHETVKRAHGERFKRIIARDTKRALPDRVLHERADDRGGWRFRIAGADGSEVFVVETATIDNPASLGTIRAYAKSGDGDRTLVADEPISETVVLDPDFLTWVTTDGLVRRVPIRVRGDVETVTPSPMYHSVPTIRLAVDRCNLYWSVGQIGSSAIYARSRHR